MHSHIYIALFTVASQSMSWISKLQHLHTMEYHLLTPQRERKHEILLCSADGLEDLSDMSQSQNEYALQDRRLHSV